MIDPATIRVVFVEDDEELREAVVQGLEIEGMTVDAFEAAGPALRQLSPEFAGVVVSDIRLPGIDGLEFFEALREMDETLPIIFTTGHGDVAMAVEAMKKGATDFLTKPYSSAALAESIIRAADKRALVLENRKLKEALRSRGTPTLLGSSEQIDRLNQLISEVGKADIDLLITGESGTGKSFVARQTHELSSRRARPFVTIDAGIWAHQDAELIIFGRNSEGGLSRAGLVERANGGTLFLDDIETMPVQFQARMISVAEQRSYIAIGSARPRTMNVRIISASQRVPLIEASLSGLAQSLFHRLSSVTVALPTLASHREDVPEIFRHFVAGFEKEFETTARDLSAIQWSHLTDHQWPGNMHELRTYARTFVLGLQGGDNLRLLDKSVKGTLKDRISDFERAVLEDALRSCGGRIPEIADSLGIPRKTLYDKLTKHGLQAREFRP